MDAESATGAIAARLASRQHGVVSRRQLLAAGIGRGAVRRGIESGRFHLVHRGVYAVGHPALPARGRWAAAVLAAGGGPLPGVSGAVIDVWGAALSHRSAAELWGLLVPVEGPVDVVVLGDGGRRRPSGIRIHRSRSLSRRDVTLREGIPVTTAARTIADLRRAAARRLPGALGSRELRHAIREAEVAGLPIGASTATDRTRSELEGLFLRLCRAWRLPNPEVNVRLGPYLVDFLWRRHLLVVETDGYRYHRGEAAFEERGRRDLHLREMGYAVIHLTGAQLADEPERVRAMLVRELSGGAGPPE